MAAPIVDTGGQRIYHVTHIDNLEGILEAGALLARTGGSANAAPVVDICSPAHREALEATTVSGVAASRYLHFFLSPDANLWVSLRSGIADTRLSHDPYRSAVSEFVVLASVVKYARDVEDDESGTSRFAVADGDAVGERTRVETSKAGAERMLRKLYADEDPQGLLEAELLVAEAFPFEFVSLVGVANVKVRERVKELLAPRGYRTRVAAHPPWFDVA